MAQGYSLYKLPVPQSIIVTVHGVTTPVYRNPPKCKRLQGAADARRRVRRRTSCTSSARQQSRCGALWTLTH